MNQHHLEIIQVIAERISGKYVFGYFDQEDLQQEAVIFGLEAYDRWDGVRPLENFVSVHISNRLKNLKRDNYFRLGLEDSSPERQQSNENKRKLMNPAQLTPFSFYTEDEIDGWDEVQFVLSKLPPLMRNDFLRLANDVSIPKARRTAIYDKVREILDENG